MDQFHKASSSMINQSTFATDDQIPPSNVSTIFNPSSYSISYENNKDNETYISSQTRYSNRFYLTQLI